MRSPGWRTISDTSSMPPRENLNPDPECTKNLGNLKLMQNQPQVCGIEVYELSGSRGTIRRYMVGCFLYGPPSPPPPNPLTPYDQIREVQDVRLLKFSWQCPEWQAGINGIGAEWQ